MAAKKELEISVLSPRWEKSLAVFFAALLKNRDNKYFHPHDLTPEEAERRCNYRGNDIYYVCAEGEDILGYAMLRGWDEGYEIPSVGIVVHPSTRGEGLGKMLMHFLHTVARRKGAKRVRLTVYKENIAAMKLYEKIGYKFQSENTEARQVGFYDLC